MNLGKDGCPDGKTCCVAKSMFDICKQLRGGTCRYICKEKEHGDGKVDCPDQKTCCVVTKDNADLL